MILLVLAGMAAWTFSQLAQARVREAHRFQSVLAAEFLADSGLAATTEWLRTRPMDSSADLSRSMLELSPEDLEGWKTSPPQELFDELVSLVPRAESLETWIELRHVRSLVPESGSFGLQPDPFEKLGELRVGARAQVGGFRREVLWTRSFKLLRPTVPLLSKFTLFLTQDSEDWNRLKREPGGTSYGGQPAAPLVLQNHSWSIPSFDQGELLPLAPSLPSWEQIEAGGWVFLGGKKPWQLQPLDGVVEGESFQWRRQPLDAKSELPGVQREQVFPLGFGNQRLEEVGYAGSLLDPAWDRAFPLMLFGDAARVTPTLVLGEVRRRLLWVSGVDGQVVPWCGAGTPCHADFPGGAGEQARRSPTILEGPLMDSLACMQGNQEGASLDLDRMQGDPGDDTNLEDLVRLQFPGAEAGSLAVAAAAHSDQVRISRDAGNLLFEGSLYGIDGDWLERVLAVRTTHFFSNQAALVEAGFPNAPELQSGVFWIGEGGLELAPGTYPGGVVLVCPGEIRVPAGFLSPPEDLPPSLVSLNGDIQLLGADPLSAHLVALRGGVKASGAWKIRGAVAVGRFDPSEVLSGEKGLLEYNEALDGTTASRARAQVQLFLDPKPRLFLGGDS